MAPFGRRIPPARPYESCHPGQALGVGSAAPAPCFLTQGTCSPFFMNTSRYLHVPPLLQVLVTPRGVTSGTPCSPGPARGLGGALLNGPLALPASSWGGGVPTPSLGWCVEMLPSLSLPKKGNKSHLCPRAKNWPLSELFSIPYGWLTPMSHA